MATPLRTKTPVAAPPSATIRLNRIPTPYPGSFATPRRSCLAFMSRLFPCIRTRRRNPLPATSAASISRPASTAILATATPGVLAVAASSTSTSMPSMPAPNQILHGNSAKPPIDGSRRLEDSGFGIASIPMAATENFQRSIKIIEPDLAGLSRQPSQLPDLHLSVALPPSPLFSPVDSTD